MMNQDKILELLAEYLRKTDRIMERLDRQEERQVKQDERYTRQEEFSARQDHRLDMAYQVLIGHSEKIEALQVESNKLQLESNKLQEQMKKIEIRTDATWKEFLAVTKRLGTKKRKR